MGNTEIKDSSFKNSGGAGGRPGGASKLVSPVERSPRHTLICPYIFAGEDPLKVCDEIYGFFPEEQAEICDACLKGKLYQPRKRGKTK